MEKRDSLIQKIGVFILVLISMYLLPSLIYSLVSKISIIRSSTFVELSTYIIYISLMVMFFYKDLKKEFKSFINNYRSDMNTGFKYWALGLFIMMAANLVLNVFVFKKIAANESLVRESIFANPLYMILSVGIMAPIMEELVFRKSLRDIFKNGELFAIISGLLFGFAHTMADLSTPLNLLYIIPYGALGYGFAKAAFETKSTVTSIIMHSIHNILTFALIYFTLG